MEWVEGGLGLAQPLTDDDPREVAGYQLRARLGAGGMGRVYLAFTRGGRPVAIKLLRAEFGDEEEFRTRFGREVVAAQRVHGLYTAQVLDADPDAPQPWLATAYVPGLSLQQAVAAHGPLPPDSVFLLVAGVAEALQAIHAVGIVHRDLKPSNVILAADGPRVIDFGIARAATAVALTRGGARIGSPRFMAPEQARGQPTTPAVDVFALGSLATYAIAGRPPFGGDRPITVLYRVLNEAPDLGDCPADLRPLIERCLAKDPEQRPQPSEIIDLCRARTADGSLAFDRSWLPAAVSAAAAAPLAELLLRTDGGPGEGTSESTFSREGSGYSGAGQPGEDTFSGDVRAPQERPAAEQAAAEQAAAEQAAAEQAAAEQAVAARLAAELLAAGIAAPGQAGQPGAPAGGLKAGAAPAGGVNVEAAPAGAGASADARLGAAAGAGEGAGAGESAGLGGGGDDRPGARRKAVAWWSVAGVVLVAAAAVGIALMPGPVGLGTGQGRSQVLATSGPGTLAPSARAQPTATAQRAPTAAPRSSLPLARKPSASAVARPTPGLPTPVRSPVQISTSPSPAPTGQAAFAGSWSGTVSQPTGTVTSWTVQLYIPVTGDGSYSAPSLGCSGTLVIRKTKSTTMHARAETTSAVNTGCVAEAGLILTLAGPGEIDMTWKPAGHPRKAGTAVLTGS